MDVRCGRCGTEYEFDDALVSERGTTVKCTNCGHQFKVHPPRSGHTGPERWVVRTASGRELVYTSLRDLQKGIAQRQVGPGDLLARGNQPARPLGSIAELEPFFQRGGATRPSHVPRTLAGVAPPANVVTHPPDVRVQEHPRGSAHELAATQPSAVSPTPAPRPDPKRADAFAGTVPIDFNQAGVAHPEGRLEEAEPPTLPRNERPVPSVEPRTQPRPAPAQAYGRPEPVLTPTPSAIRDSFHSEAEIHTDPRYLAGPPSRRARSRWIAALVIIGVIALFGATVGREYITRFSHLAQQETKKPASDGRVATMLESGNRLLSDGDFEGAKEQFDKASALAEADPAVLAALAHLETLRADLVWIQLRLLDPSDKEIVNLTHRQLGARVGRAERAVDAARKVAPNDPAVLRARIDVLRMDGKIKQARSLVGPIAKDASQPANAYVLAALDLAEPSPGWSTVIDRLRTASAGERDLLRARPALVYALARSGQVSQAETELNKLESSARAHPLSSELKGFVHRFESAEADAGTEAGAEVATVDPSQLPKLDTSSTNVPEEPASGDFRTKLEQASAAASRGDLERAQQLYNAVLAQHPDNTEALAGLADVARKRKDTATAQKLYEKVLKDNPGYLPALVARADQKWDSGDRAGAVAMYRRVLEQAGPGSSYGQHAAARIAQGEKSGSSAAGGSQASPPPEKPAPSTSSTAEPPPEPKPKQEPHIDTTDLPGFNE